MKKLTSISNKRIPKAVWYLSSLFIASLFYLLLQGGRISGIMFFFVCVITIYLILGRWSGIRKVEGTRTLLNATGSNKITAGQSLQLKVVFYVPGFWPLPYVTIKEKLMRKGGLLTVHQGTIVLNWARMGDLTYSTPPLARGIYHFERTELVTTDIFGLIEHRGETNVPRYITVLPEMVDLRESIQLRQLLRGMQHHTLSTLAHRETTQINGVREYIYGDKLSRIHWNATARTGVWKSKEFEREALPQTILVLDRNHTVYSNAAQFELAVSIVASFLRFGFEQHMPMHLLSVGQDLKHFNGGLYQDNFEEMMTHLVDVEPDGIYSLEHSLTALGNQFIGGSFFIFISPKAGTEMAKCISWVKRNGMKGCQILVEPQGSSTVLKAKNQEWIEYLYAEGMMGYAISELSMLPMKLEGAKMHG